MILLGIYEYNQLDKDTQLEIALMESEYIMYRLEKEYGFNLYAYNDFYIEVIYDQKKSVIEGVKTFKKGQFLDAYLERINITFTA